MRRAEHAPTSPEGSPAGRPEGYRERYPAEASGFRPLGRRLGRARGFVLFAPLLALSGGASLLEDAALPLWANLAALCLAFLLAYGALMRLSDAEPPDEPSPHEASTPAPTERRPANAPGGVSFGAEGSGGLSAARRARPLVDPDDARTADRRPT